MWTKVTVIGCGLLTALVVHTALRIEHINTLSGTYLPRSPDVAHEEWVVPELTLVLNFVDRQIALRRVDAFSMTNPDKPVPQAEELVGGPYDETELNLIERTKQDHAVYSELHWWCTKFGALQIALAPLALVWSLGNFLTLRKNLIRLLSTSCALLAVGAIFLMVLRGY